MAYLLVLMTNLICDITGQPLSNNNKNQNRILVFYNAIQVIFKCPFIEKKNKKMQKYRERERDMSEKRQRKNDQLCLKLTSKIKTSFVD